MNEQTTTHTLITDDLAVAYAVAKLAGGQAFVAMKRELLALLGPYWNEQDFARHLSENRERILAALAAARSVDAANATSPDNEREDVDIDPRGNDGWYAAPSEAPNEETRDA